MKKKTVNTGIENENKTKENLSIDDHCVYRTHTHTQKHIT